MGTNELLFYGGLALAALSLLVGIGFFFGSRMKKISLTLRLNEEYGPSPSEKEERSGGEKGQ